MQLVLRPSAHPDVTRLVERLQDEYVAIYGGRDETHVRPEEFEPPLGELVVGYVDSLPVAMGGWRPSGNARAELKRMFVVPEHRGQGLARSVLRRIEEGAAAAGRRRLVLETGTRQPTAVALYRSAGYEPVDPFGHYADEPGSIHLGIRLPRPSAAGGEARGRSPLGW